MKPERNESAAELVVDCEQCRDEWAIRLIARQRAESRRVAEEERNVSQVSDGRVSYDRMRVVEMETVVKMVRVGRGDCQRSRLQWRELFSHYLSQLPLALAGLGLVSKCPISGVTGHLIGAARRLDRVNAWIERDRRTRIGCA